MKKREPTLEKLLSGDLLDLSPLQRDAMRRLLLEALRDRMPEYTQRSPEDPGIALLDALAIALDVTGFYHDRIVTESKVGSARRLSSVARLGEVVGFRPTPALSATLIQFFEARASAVLPALTKIAGKRLDLDPPKAVAFETLESVSISPAYNKMPLPAVITRRPGATRAALLAAEGSVLDPCPGEGGGEILPESWPASPGEARRPDDAFTPGGHALIGDAYGLELVPIMGMRSRSVAFASPLRASYGAGDALLSPATCYRHLRHPSALAVGDAAQAPQDGSWRLADLSGDPELVAYEVSARPILHYPDEKARQGLASTLRIFVFDESIDPGAPEGWRDEDAWEEVEDFGESEASDRHFRTFVDDRLFTYVILRRRLGHRRLLSDDQLGRVYARFLPAIGDVLARHACEGDPPPLCPESPPDLAHATLKLDQRSYTRSLVCPPTALPEHNAADWAVTDIPLNLGIGDQVVVQNLDSGSVSIRTLSELRGRYLDWTGDPSGQSGSSPSPALLDLWIRVAHSLKRWTPEDPCAEPACPTLPRALSGPTVERVLGPAFPSEIAYAVRPGRGLLYLERGTSTPTCDGDEVAPTHPTEWPETVPEAHDLVWGCFQPKQTLIAPLRSALGGRRLDLWDPFYRQVGHPDWAAWLRPGDERFDLTPCDTNLFWAPPAPPEEVEDPSGEGTDQGAGDGAPAAAGAKATAASAKAAAAYVTAESALVEDLSDHLRQVVVIGRGASFLWMEDTSLIEPGTYVLIGKRIRQGYRIEDLYPVGWAHTEGEGEEPACVQARVLKPECTIQPPPVQDVEEDGEGDQEDQEGQEVQEGQEDPDGGAPEAEAEAEAKEGLSMGDDFGWIKAEIVQVAEVTGNLVRLSTPTTNAYSLDFLIHPEEEEAPEDHGASTTAGALEEVISEIVAVPQVASVYYGDQFRQQVLLTAQGTTVAPLDLESLKYLQVELNVGIPEALRTALADGSPSSGSVASKYEDLFIGALTQIQALVALEPQALEHYFVRITREGVVRQDLVKLDLSIPDGSAEGATLSTVEIGTTEKIYVDWLNERGRFDVEMTHQIEAAAVYEGRVSGTGSIYLKPLPVGIEDAQSAQDVRDLTWWSAYTTGLKALSVLKFSGWFAPLSDVPGGLEADHTLILSAPSLAPLAFLGSWITTAPIASGGYRFIARTTETEDETELPGPYLSDTDHEILDEFSDATDLIVTVLTNESVDLDDEIEIDVTFRLDGINNDLGAQLQEWPSIGILYEVNSTSGQPIYRVESGTLSTEGETDPYALLLQSRLTFGEESTEFYQLSPFASGGASHVIDMTHRPVEKSEVRAGWPMEQTLPAPPVPDEGGWPTLLVFNDASGHPGSWQLSRLVSENAGGEANWTLEVTGEVQGEEGQSISWDPRTEDGSGLGEIAPFSRTGGGLQDPTWRDVLVLLALSQAGSEPVPDSLIGGALVLWSTPPDEEEALPTPVTTLEGSYQSEGGSPQWAFSFLEPDGFEGTVTAAWDTWEATVEGASTPVRLLPWKGFSDEGGEAPAPPSEDLLLLVSSTGDRMSSCLCSVDQSSIGTALRTVENLTISPCIWNTANFDALSIRRVYQLVEPDILGVRRVTDIVRETNKITFRLTGPDFIESPEERIDTIFIRVETDGGSWVWRGTNFQIIDRDQTSGAFSIAFDNSDSARTFPTSVTTDDIESLHQGISTSFNYANAAAIFEAKEYILNLSQGSSAPPDMTHFAKEVLHRGDDLTPSFISALWSESRENILKIVVSNDDAAGLETAQALYIRLRGFVVDGTKVTISSSEQSFLTGTFSEATDQYSELLAIDEQGGIVVAFKDGIYRYINAKLVRIEDDEATFQVHRNDLDLEDAEYIYPAFGLFTPALTGQTFSLVNLNMDNPDEDLTSVVGAVRSSAGLSDGQTLRTDDFDLVSAHESLAPMQMPNGTLRLPLAHTFDSLYPKEQGDSLSLNLTFAQSLPLVAYGAVQLTIANTGLTQTSPPLNTLLFTQDLSESANTARYRGDAFSLDQQVITLLPVDGESTLELTLLFDEGTSGPPVHLSHRWSTIRLGYEWPASSEPDTLLHNTTLSLALGQQPPHIDHPDTASSLVELSLLDRISLSMAIHPSAGEGDAGAVESAEITLGCQSNASWAVDFNVDLCGRDPKALRLDALREVPFPRDFYAGVSLETLPASRFERSKPWYLTFLESPEAETDATASDAPLLSEQVLFYDVHHSEVIEGGSDATTRTGRFLVYGVPTDDGPVSPAVAAFFASGRPPLRVLLNIASELEEEIYLPSGGWYHEFLKENILAEAAYDQSDAVSVLFFDLELELDSRPLLSAPTFQNGVEPKVNGQNISLLLSSQKTLDQVNDGQPRPGQGVNAPAWSGVDTSAATVTGMEVQLVAYSQSVVFPTGNFIPVRLTDPDVDAIVIDSSLRIFRLVPPRSGSGEPTYEPTRYAPERMKLITEAIDGGSLSTTMVLEDGGEEVAVEGSYYSFNKTLEGDFSLNFLILTTERRTLGDPPQTNTLPVDVFVKYAAPRAEPETGAVPDETPGVVRHYAFETHLWLWNPLTQLVVADGSAIKPGHTLLLRPSDDPTGSKIIQWTRVQEVFGQVVTVWPPLKYQPRAYTRYVLSLLETPQIKAGLLPAYYHALTQVVEGDERALALRDHLVLEPLLPTEPVQGDEASGGPRPSPAINPLLQALVPGDRLLVWDEAARLAWFHARTQGREAPESDGWSRWPDRQYEARILSVDAELGLVILDRPLPLGFQVGYAWDEDPPLDEGVLTPWSASTLAALQEITVLPHHREPIQGARQRLTLGDGDRTVRFPRFTATLPGGTGLGSLPAPEPGVWVSNMEVFTVEPRSGEWARWRWHRSLQTAGRKDPAFTLGLSPVRWTDLASGPSQDTRQVSIAFGDGLTGARLPTGVDNVLLRVADIGPSVLHHARPQEVCVSPLRGDQCTPLDPATVHGRPQTPTCIADLGDHAGWCPSAGTSGWRPSLHLEIPTQRLGQEQPQTLILQEITDEEAQEGRDGLLVRSKGPGRVEVFIITTEPLTIRPLGAAPDVDTPWVAFETGHRAFSIPPKGPWGLDVPFYTETLALDPAETLGATELVVDETDGLRRGSLLSFSRGEGDGAPELVQVDAVDHGRYALSLSTPLGRTYRPGSAYIRGNLARAVEGRSEAYIIGSGDGHSPDLTLSLQNRAPLLFLPGSAEAPDPQPALVLRVEGEAWSPIVDFEAAGPGDKVYQLLLTEAGEASIRFGDGQRGLIPPAGKDNIRVLVRTGPGGLGSVEVGSLTQLRDGSVAVAGTANVTQGAGSRAAETPDEARESLMTRSHALGRVVTAEDGVRVAQATGEVEHARLDGAAPPEVLRLTVSLFGRRAPSEDLIARVHQDLSALLPAAAGVRVEVLGATQVPVYLSVDITLAEGVEGGAVLLALEARFSGGDEGFFASAQWPIGRALRAGDVYEGIHQVPGVARARIRWMSRERPPEDPSDSPNVVEPGPGGVIRCESDPKGDPYFKRGRARFTLKEAL